MRQGDNTAHPCFAQNRPNQSRLLALKRGYLRPSDRAQITDIRKVRKARTADFLAG